MMVSQLLIELPRTLNSQHRVEFDFQFSSFRRKNEAFYAFFRTFLVFLKKILLLSDVHLLLHCAPHPPYQQNVDKKTYFFKTPP